MIRFLIQKWNESREPKGINAQGHVIQKLNFRQFLQLANTCESHFQSARALEFSEDLVAFAREPLPTKPLSILVNPESEAIRL